MYLSNIHSVVSNRVKNEKGGDLELAVPTNYAIGAYSRVLSKHLLNKRTKSIWGQILINMRITHPNPVYLSAFVFLPCP